MRLLIRSAIFARRNSPLQPPPDYAGDRHPRGSAIEASSVLLIGTGGLGSPTALYLAAAGIGRIGLVDYDTVDETNLQRQVIHGQSQRRCAEVESANSGMLDINPFLAVMFIMCR